MGPTERNRGQTKTGRRDRCRVLRRSATVRRVKPYPQAHLTVISTEYGANMSVALAASFEINLKLHFSIFLTARPRMEEKNERLNIVFLFPAKCDRMVRTHREEYGITRSGIW